MSKEKPVPDVVREGLDALFVGINPGLVSAREGHHFANPANAFWRLLHEAGFTSRRLLPREERALLDEGLGITNLVSRETPGVADLTREDIEKGRAELTQTIARFRPRAIVFVGITSYRAFLGRSSERITCGKQPQPIEGATVYVLPNPSGRNAHYKYPEMLALYRQVAADLGRAPKPSGKARRRS